MTTPPSTGTRPSTTGGPSWRAGGAVRSLAASPFDVYRCLRAVNPSPYMFFLALGGDRHVVGTSPEKLIQVEGRRDTVLAAFAREQGPGE